jgi:hypothetical protein
MDKQKSLDTLFAFIFSHNNHSNNDYNNDLLLKQRVFNLILKIFKKSFFLGKFRKIFGAEPEIIILKLCKTEDILIFLKNQTINKFKVQSFSASD